MTMQPTIPQTVRILNKLDEVFIAGRFKSGWSDKKVGDELSIPHALVTMVREQSPDHGKIKGDPEVDAIKSEVAAVDAMLSDIKTRLSKLEARFR